MQHFPMLQNPAQVHAWMVSGAATIHGYLDCTLNAKSMNSYKVFCFSHAVTKSTFLYHLIIILEVVVLEAIKKRSLIILATNPIMYIA